MFVMLDSGAFSAWTQKKAVDIDEYCLFILEHKEHIDAYVALDVIPEGAASGTPSKEAAERACEQGWENLLYMREEYGLDPIPVFHQGEDPKWLHKMLELGCGYVGLSARVKNPVPLKRRWLDTAWKHLVDAEGRPTVKVHGFAMTAITLLLRYPWHTADSTSWLMMGINGHLYVPKFSAATGTWDFTKGPKTVTVGEKSNAVHGQNVKHLQGGELERVHQWLAEAGRTLEQCVTDHSARCYVNAYFFARASDHISKLDIRFKPRHAGLFS